jgi:hypothetical protein
MNGMYFNGGRDLRSEKRLSEPFYKELLNTFSTAEV